MEGGLDARENRVLETKFGEVEISVATETDELGDPLQYMLQGERQNRAERRRST